jgi:hypothetical protein
MRHQSCYIEENMPGNCRQESIKIAFTLLFLASSTAWAENPTLSPDDLVRKSVANEIKAANDNTAFLFRARKQTPRGSQTHLYVQTRDAMVGMLIAVNDQPLKGDQLAAEEGHLQFLANNPDEVKKKQQREKDDAERVGRIVRALPSAFLYEYAGTAPGQPGVGKPGDELVRLNFRSNPKYNPPTRVEQVLVGMRGYLMIDANHFRIAKIDGTLFKDVSFGWGILGHLDKGGQFQVDQGNVGDSAFEITRMTLSFTGKLLLFKSIVIKSTEVYYDFQPVPPNLTFAQGVALLKKQHQETTASSIHGGTHP